MVGLVGQYCRDALGHTVKLTGLAAKPLSNGSVLILGDVLGKPAVPELKSLHRSTSRQNHPNRGREQAGRRGFMPCGLSKEAAG